MITALFYSSVYFVCAVPYEKLLNRLFSRPNTSDDRIVEPGYVIRGQLMTWLVYVGLGHGLVDVLHQFFYYDNPLFFIVGFFIGCLGCFWSIFNWKRPVQFFYFIVGVYSFFSWHFLWIFGALFLALSVILNHSILGYIGAILGSFLGVFIEEIDPLFMVVNWVILTLFIIKQGKAIGSIFTGSTGSLLRQFKNR